MRSFEVQTDRRIRFLAIVVWGLLAVGCSTEGTIASRRQQRASAYSALSAEDRAAVDQGQVRAGMSEDAVFIAWGPPAQVLRAGNSGGEELVRWLYENVVTDSYHYWNSYPSSKRSGRYWSDRTAETAYDFRNYVSAEVIFRGGKVDSWQTLPRPAEQNIYVPGGY